MRELPDGAAPLLADGTRDPRVVGFSRRPFAAAPLAGRWPRKKRWDYWCITHEHGALALVVADVDYLGLAAITYFDFDEREQTERAFAAPLGLGCRLPDRFDAPTMHRSPGLAIEITDAPDGTHIEARGASRWGETIEATLWIEPAEETLNVVVPMAGDTFQINAKHAARRAMGDVRIGDRLVTLRDGAYAARDWGRGIWPYATRWNWACASGTVAGQRVGVNLGGAWTDDTGATENAITVDGRLHVISDDLDWAYDPGDDGKPWRIRDRRGRVDVRVTPFWPITRRADALVLRSALHLVWGTFSGTIEADDGARVELDGLLGWAEEHVARW